MKTRRIMLCSLVSLIMIFVMAVPMTVSADTAKNVAKVGDTEYATLENAFAAVSSGGTVTLLESTNVNAGLTVDKNVTLNLAGKTLTVNKNANQGISSDVTITGQLTIDDTDGGVVEFKGDTCFVIDGASAKATLQKGKILCNEGQGTAFYAKNGGTVVVNGGVIESLYVSISGNNTTGDMNFEVNGGIITAKYGPAIYMPGQVNLKITDGTLNGGISLRMGHIEISGGTINAATANLDDPKEYYSYSGNAWLPDALYVFGGTYTSASGNDLDLKITGGTFNCENGQGSGIAIYDIGRTAQKMNASISGNAIVKTNATSRDAYQVLSLKDIGVTNPKEGYGKTELTGKVQSTISAGEFSTDVAEKYLAADVVTATYEVNGVTTYLVGKETINNKLNTAENGTITITNTPGGTILDAPKNGVTLKNGSDKTVIAGTGNEKVELGKEQIYKKPEIAEPTTPSQDPSQKPADNAKADKNVATGDDFNMLAAGGAALAAIIAMAAVVITGRRQRQK